MRLVVVIVEEGTRLCLSLLLLHEMASQHQEKIKTACLCKSELNK
jgi:hypothetical protein